MSTASRLVFDVTVSPFDLSPDKEARLAQMREIDAASQKWKLEHDIAATVRVTLNLEGTQTIEDSPALEQFSPLIDEIRVMLEMPGYLITGRVPIDTPRDSDTAPLEAAVIKLIYEYLMPLFPRGSEPFFSHSIITS